MCMAGRCLETHKMAEIDGPEQGTVVLDGMVQVVAGGVDPRQVLGVDKAQDMVHDLEGQLCNEDHCDARQAGAAQPGTSGRKSGFSQGRLSSGCQGHVGCDATGEEGKHSRIIYSRAGLREGVGVAGGRWADDGEGTW